jgi:hypothetical protein
LTEGRTKIQEWSSTHHQRKVTETTYPSSLDWNDWTNNIVGLFNQSQPSTTASVWENQALFDFDNRAVPAHGMCTYRSLKAADLSVVTFSV